MDISVRTDSERGTERLAERLAALLRAGDILLLYGGVGAGKTAFARGLARGLGCADAVSSPTFALMNRYEGGRLALNHFDLYRLSSAEEADDLDIPGEAEGRVTAVEWPQVAGRWLGEAARFVVTIQDGGEDGDSRVITLSGLREGEADALSGD